MGLIYGIHLFQSISVNITYVSYSQRKLTHSKGACRDDLIRARDLDVFAANVSPHGSSRDIEAERFAEANLDNRQLRLPLINGNAGQDVFRSLARVEAMRSHEAVDFVASQAVPLLVLGQVAQDPSGINSAIDKAGKQSSDDELVMYTVSGLGLFVST